MEDISEPGRSAQSQMAGVGTVELDSSVLWMQGTDWFWLAWDFQVWTSQVLHSGWLGEFMAPDWMGMDINEDFCIQNCNTDSCDGRFALRREGSGISGPSNTVMGQGPGPSPKASLEGKRRLICWGCSGCTFLKISFQIWAAWVSRLNQDHKTLDPALGVGGGVVST